MLNIGNPAPDFKSEDQNGEEISLKQFRGRKVLLYFYPKDNTPGCTVEACALRDNFKKITDLGVVILGVSADNAGSHQKFITKHDLPFDLIVDDQKEIINIYEALGEKTMFGKKYLGIIRKSYLIDEEGNILKIWPKVNPLKHASEVLDFLVSI